MSLLKAMDEAVETRRLIHELGTALEQAEIPSELRADLLEAYFPVWEMINRTVRDAEDALVPAGLRVAISFMPDDRPERRAVAESGAGYRMPRRGGDPRGTMVLPSDPPDGE